MRVQVVDPSAYTIPYDHALCAALARAGSEVELITSRFPYASAPTPDGYAVNELFYPHARGEAGTWLRRATKLLEHIPDMLALRRHALSAEVVHFQWLPVQPIDRHLLPSRPTVLTAHDILPREPRPFQARAHRQLYDVVDAVVVHSQFGRDRLVEDLGVPAAKVRVVHHGALDYLARLKDGELPRELHGDRRMDGPPIALFFGLLRPYKGIDVLLDAWREVIGGELWIVGRPRMALDQLVASAPPGVKWVPRFVSDSELAACFRCADLLVLPYLRTDRLDFSGVLATALAFGKPVVLTDVGGFRELADAGAARVVVPGDPAALAAALNDLLSDPQQREALAAGARAAAAGPYSWDEAARETLALYRELVG